jgi:hypothetical protein
MNTFRIVENFDYENRYDDFKEDFLNGMNKSDLRNKYDIPPRIWKEWRDRILSENESNRRVKGTYKRPRKYKENFSDNFFRTTYKGNVTVVRRMDSGKNYSYGSFPDMDTAIKVRDLLVDSDWDKYVAYDLLQEYGVANSKKCLSCKLLRREF